MLVGAMSLLPVTVGVSVGPLLGELAISTVLVGGIDCGAVVVCAWRCVVVSVEVGGRALLDGWVGVEGACGLV